MRSKDLAAQPPSNRHCSALPLWKANTSHMLTVHIFKEIPHQQRDAFTLPGLSQRHKRDAFTLPGLSQCHSRSPRSRRKPVQLLRARAPASIPTAIFGPSMLSPGRQMANSSPPPAQMSSCGRPPPAKPSLPIVDTQKQLMPWRGLPIGEQRLLDVAIVSPLAAMIKPYRFGTPLPAKTSLHILVMPISYAAGV